MSSKDPIDIWLRAEQGSAGRKPEHSRASIVQAAVKIADDQGIEAVSIRKVAAAIGAGAASLYRYVKSHDELIELMLDEISGEYVLDPANGAEGEAPQRALLDLARQGRQIMRRHLWSAPLFLSQPSMGPNSLAYLDFALSILQETSLESSAKLRTAAMLTAVTSAFVQNELPLHPGANHSPVDASARAAYMAQVLPTDAYPALAAVMAEELAPVNLDMEFEKIIGTYLQGAGLSERK
ncbi:hypothetical protein AUR04nite_12240 [Glutamicibacter uratoxydans]|uniref:HTH tetR-type domain-containing protein n=1 Tax=Glutamicibacter uratoxydans TaxID=43667 RepID=A0A4Y4DK66_GLUUR|nr:TetR/AcrR family transcriptional regulator C-terminal domain-containing protein [Glutamicibacter uratoxydans]GED05692.1 hypothetical protein AUR04nite_12240 [Glutamicibacter uratoxydans]